jgi:two-component system, response regulator
MRDKTILLVEDNRDDAELTMHALQRNGIDCDIVHLKNGADALDWLFARGPHASRDVSKLPLLVLLDLKLPKVSGLQVLEQLRQDPRTKLLPVVVLTSSLEHTDLTRAYSLGANSYVRKPVDFGDFQEAANRLGVYWLLLNQPPPSGATGP